MGDVARQGRTVLFVSHNMAAIKQLCNLAMTFQGGRLLSHGPVEELVREYLLSGSNQCGFVIFLLDSHNSKKQKRAFFRSVSIVNRVGKTTSTIDVRHGFTLELFYEVPEPLRHLEVGIRISTSDNNPVMTSLISEQFPTLQDGDQQGIVRATVSIPGEFLIPGSYLITIALMDGSQQIIDSHEGILRMDVEDTGTVFSKYKNNRAMGVVMRSLDWTYTPGVRWQTPSAV